MANPNIVNVSDIRGKTTAGTLTTANANLLSNSAGSGKVFKINTIIIANVDGTNAADVIIGFDDASAAANHKLASTISVPADSTLVVISKDTALYLEEGDSIQGNASASNDLDYVISYEEIS